LGGVCCMDIGGGWDWWGEDSICCCW
jgi:hypothetical protein